MSAVVGENGIQVFAPNRPDEGPRGDQAAQRAAPARALVGEGEAGFAIVVLLGDDAIEADRAAGGASDAGVPDGLAIAFAAMRGVRDVEAEESEGVISNLAKPQLSM